MSHEPRRTILIVDDNPRDIAAVHSLLSSHGFRILVKRSMEDAENLLRRADGNIELVLLDGRIHREATAKHIADLKRYDVPIVCLSRNNFAPEKKRAFEAGAVDYILKRTDPAELVVRVSTQIDRRRLEREREEQTRRLASLRELVQHFFPEQLFRRMEEGVTDLRMEEKDITIAFWDIRGFSELCYFFRGEPPEMLLGFLSAFFTTSAQIIDRHHGLLDKFIGDGIMVLFGTWASTVSERDAATADALACAYEMRAEFTRLTAVWRGHWELNAKLTLNPPPGLAIGCGIHRGKAFVGRLGTPRDQFTAIGPHVNFCARVEGVSGKKMAEGKELPSILVSQSIVAALPRQRFVPVEKTLELKGFGKEIQLFTPETDANGSVTEMLPPVPPAAADLVFDRLGTYERIRVLNEGGMGVVYLARHIPFGWLRAIKVMRGIEDATSVRRFKQEAEVAGHVNHRNVATIYDLGEVDGTPYIVMEYVEGVSFRQLLEGGRIERRRVASLIAQAAEGFAAVHALGVIHRDIKPENIMVGNAVDKSELVKIVDFGIAKLVEGARQITATGMIAGTPDYMSPEQVLGQDLDLRSDLYSLAVVAFEMLTGVVPFRGDSPIGAMVMRLDQRPPQLCEGCDEEEWPPELDAVLQQAMSTDPTERFEAMPQFAAAFHSAIAR